MKKRICALALTLTLMAGGMAAAEDLKTADGHILPLGNTITLREGKDSYIGKELHEKWDKEKVKKEILSMIQKKKLFPRGDTVHEDMLAEQMVKLFEVSQFDQLQFETGDAYHHAIVMSTKLEEKDLAHWSELVKFSVKARNNGLDTMDGSVLTLKDIGKLMEKESRENRYIYKEDGKKEYIYRGSLMTVEQNGMEMPFYMFILASVDDKQLGATIIYTNQATGKLLDPILKKGAEELR